MADQNKLDKIFMRIAEDFATLSHCISHRVGCVAVIDNRIIATGINGTPKGMVNCDELFYDYQSDRDRQDHHEWSLAHEIHAEMNVIIFCAKNGITLDGATLYSTVQPCQHCTKNLLQSGIKRIVYKYPYDKAISSDLIRNYIKDNNIIIEQIKE